MPRNFRRKHASHPIADLNVTNLIDLGFMLLIIFMVATPLIQQEQKVQVELPIESASKQPTIDKNQRMETITVQADGRILLGGRPYSMRQLMPELDKFAAEPKPPVINLRFDAKSTAQDWISILDELKKRNLTKMAVDTKLAR
jgi:biopolymer transport protein TolR